MKVEEEENEKGSVGRREGIGKRDEGGERDGG